MKPQTHFIGEDTMSRKIAQIWKSTGKTAAWIVRDICRLWVNDLIRYTGGNGNKTLPGQKRQMEASMESELKQMFYPVSDAWPRYQMENDWVITNSSTGGVFRIHKSEYDIPSSQPKMHTRHQAWRDKRGHVQKFAGQIEYFKQNMPLRRQIAVQPSAFREYLRRAKQRIGRAKAGWLAAARKLGDQVPSWIQMAPSAAFGSNQIEGFVQDTLDMETISGSIFMGNDVPYIRDENGIMFRLLNKRKTDLVNGNYLRRLNRAISGKAATT